MKATTSPPPASKRDPEFEQLRLAWPNLDRSTRHAILVLADRAGDRGRPGLDLAGQLELAFAELDALAGRHNFVSLVDLRDRLGWNRAIFDAVLQRERAVGRFTLIGAEGRLGLTSAEKKAGILEDGCLLLYVARR